MFVCCLLLLLFCAGDVTETERLLVTLKQEIFPEGYSPEFGKPQLHRLFTEPSFPILVPPDAVADVPVYGTVSFGSLTSLPLMITQWPESGEDYTALYLDLNFNGDFTDDGSPWKGERNRRYGHATIFFRDVRFSLSKEAFVQDLFKPNYPTPHENPISPRATNFVTPHTHYQCALRLSLEQETEIPRIAHLYYQCRMRGTVTIQGEGYDLILLDIDGNGTFTAQDRWAFGPSSLSDDSSTPKTEDDFSLVTETRQVAPKTHWRISKLRPDGTMAMLTLSDRKIQKSLLPALEPPPPQLTPVSEKTIQWEPVFKDAVEKSAKTGRPIMLLLTTPDCAFSQAYLQGTFRDANIVELSRQVIPVHLECDQNEITDGINVPGFPYILFLNERLAIVKRVSGYCTAPVLAEYLKSVIRAFPTKTE